jgi:hypothetical protein
MTPIPPKGTRAWRNWRRQDREDELAELRHDAGFISNYLDYDSYNEGMPLVDLMDESVRSDLYETLRERVKQLAEEAERLCLSLSNALEGFPAAPGRFEREEIVDNV